METQKRDGPSEGSLTIEGELNTITLNAKPDLFAANTLSLRTTKSAGNVVFW